MDTFFIFSAKYLIVLSPLLALWIFYVAPSEIRKQIFLQSVLTLPLALGLSVLARHFYFDPRPFVVEYFTPLISHVADNGFPSDHVLLLATLASLITIFHRRMGVFLWLITLVVGIARVYVGVHHPIDIFGSILIALVSTWLVYFVLHRLKKL